jgi:MscS family membrane protein
LSKEEIETIRQEYQYILDLTGVESVFEVTGKVKSLLQPRLKRRTILLQDTNAADSLIILVRKWYRIWLKDPNLTNEDQQLLPRIWEYKIELLKRRVKRLLKKLLNPARVETRLDESTEELMKWLRTQFKQTNYVREPQVRLSKTVCDSGTIFIEVLLEYFIDDIRLEHCGRGERVNSEVYREIVKHLKPYILRHWT